MIELTTLVQIEKDESYLMLHRTKKKKDVNHDKWIGIGGHFESEESPEECLLREVKEETGLTLLHYTCRGVNTFLYGKETTEYIFLYTADAYEGKLKICDEGDLAWIKKKDLYQKNIWAGDKIFLHLLEDREKFFSLKLVYSTENILQEVVINGEKKELLTLLDEKGNRTEKVQERTVVHREGLYHETVHIWITRKCEEGYEILLQKRSKNKDSHPGCYDISSAGHMQAHDEVLDSARRELKEELGIEAEESELEWIGDHEGRFEDIFYGKQFIDHEWSHLYLYRRKINEDELVLQESEVEAVKWMNIDACIVQVKKKNPEYCLYEKGLEIFRI